ncbi:MAG: acetate/propionate family kinase [Candidatus Aminicenantes bacterium]|nr:acetate/propionate family kinase [Candidatus Aminicenantes bacterium]
MNIREVLKKHQLFQQLPGKTIALLEKEAEIVSFEPGEVIIPPGHIGKYFGIVVQGQLEAVSLNGERLGVIDKEEYFGEMSLLTGEPSTAEVRSVIESYVLLIPHNVMSRILPESPHMIKKFSSTMRVRLMQRERSVEEREALHIARGSLPGPGDLVSTPGATVKKIIVINCGDSSLKWNYYDLDSPNHITCGQLDNIGSEHTVHIVETGPIGSVKIERGLHKANHTAAFQDILNFLTGTKGPLNSLCDIDAVGHKVVHGGEKYGSPVVIDDKVLENIRELGSFSHLHNAANLKGIEAACKLLPGTIQVAVFDTAFHRTIPAYAYLYGIPRKFYEEKGIRRYGFHGTSHHYVALEAAAYIKKPIDKLKIITCHLGSRASICAVDHGRSIDTSTGFTPLEGLVMGTRSGDIDAGILIHLAREHNFTIDEISEMLNRESGLFGLSGISDNMNELKEAASQGNREALAAIRVFCYRVKKYIGAYIAVLNGIDLLVFTGSIGVSSAGVRARVCQGLDRLALLLDEIKNRSIESPKDIEDISDPSSSVKILVIPTQDEKMIARETIRALRQKEASEIMGMPRNRQQEIPISVSYRHVHLNEETRDILFGKGYKLTPDEKLSHTGQIVYRERVTLVGPRRKIEKVRIQGPMRPEAQVEIARTEEFLLGIDAPVRESGDLAGTPGITIEGPKGKVVLKQGVINIQRHIQMDPEDALLHGLRDGDKVQFTAGGERPLIFTDVLITISPHHRLEMHIDSDDAMAAGIETGMMGRISGIVGRRAE